MDKHIGWFVVELEQRLNGRLHPREIQSIVREIEAHLEESTLELGNSAIAVDGFGSPSDLAAELLEARNPAFRPSQKAANVAIACAALVAFVPVVSMFWPGFGASWFAIVLPLFAVMAFCFYRARRVLFLPLLTVIGLCWVAGAMVVAFGTYDLGELDGYHLMTKAEASKYEQGSGISFSKDRSQWVSPATSSSSQTKMVLDEIYGAKQRPAIAQFPGFALTMLPVAIMYFLAVLLVNLIAQGVNVFRRSGRFRRQLV